MATEHGKNTGAGHPAVLFDPQDRDLLVIVNEVLARERSRLYLRSLLFPYLHPNGIKDLAAPRELRVAYAMIHLLGVLAAGDAQARLSALRSVREEVLHCASGNLRNNTGRVLLQIMKDLVRSPDQERRQLELARDFRTAASGKPRVIRKLLRRYHLLEMPESWNQLAFDDHVHDVNTKGRKSPTHLIMDAWIKGIRSLTVIYYHSVSPVAAAELLEAADIMGIRVQVGVEFTARHRGRYVNIIWSLRGFSGTREFLDFLSRPDVVELMTAGRRVSEYQQRHVLAVFDTFNQRHLPAVNRDFGLDVPPLDLEAFRAYVGPGQFSLLHLAKFAHEHLLPHFAARYQELEAAAGQASPGEEPAIRDLMARLDALDSEILHERYLSRQANPDLADPAIPGEETDRPDMLTMPPCQLTAWLYRLHAGSRVTLNLSGLAAEDVLELLYECRGGITHLEIFNLKDYIAGRAEAALAVNQLQQALNAGNVLQMKRLVRGMIAAIEEKDGPDRAQRVEGLTEILRHVGELQAHYMKVPLGSRFGSDSTGRSTRVPGMGLAVVDSPAPGGPPVPVQKKPGTAIG